MISLFSWKSTLYLNNTSYHIKEFKIRGKIFILTVVNCCIFMKMHYILASVIRLLNQIMFLLFFLFSFPMQSLTVLFPKCFWITSVICLPSCISIDFRKDKPSQEKRLNTLLISFTIHLGMNFNIPFFLAWQYQRDLYIMLCPPDNLLVKTVWKKVFHKRLIM